MRSFPMWRTATRDCFAEQNQRDFAKSGTEGTCIEARELIIMLPPSLIKYDHEMLLKYMTSEFPGESMMWDAVRL